MPELKSESRECAVSPVSFWVDYETVCAPHVAAVRDVLSGRLTRYKVRFQDAVLVFHHGCLMLRIWHQGILYALPAIGVNRHGAPTVYAPGETQRGWMDDFMRLPKAIRLFCLTLLKAVFDGKTLTVQQEHPLTGQMSLASIPVALRPVLAEVSWDVR